VDSKGKYVNGKRYAQVHQLRCRFDLATLTVPLSSPGDTQAVPFNLAVQRKEINQWFLN